MSSAISRRAARPRYALCSAVAAALVSSVSSTSTADADAAAFASSSSSAALRDDTGRFFSALRAGDGAADGPADPPLEKPPDAEDRTDDDDDDDGRVARRRAAASSRASAPAVSANRLATSRSAFASFALARFSAPLRRRSSASARDVEAMNAALPNADVVPGASAAAAAASAAASARPYPGGRLPRGRSDPPSGRFRIFSGG